MNFDERLVTVQTFLDEHYHHLGLVLLTTKLMNDDRGLFSMGWDLVAYCFEEDRLIMHYIPRRDHVCLVAYYPDGSSEMLSLPGYNHHADEYEPLVEKFDLIPNHFSEYDSVIEGIRAFHADYLERLRSS